VDGDGSSFKTHAGDAEIESTTKARFPATRFQLKAEVPWGDTQMHLKRVGVTNSAKP
jgi:hypothetical protein